MAHDVRRISVTGRVAVAILAALVVLVSPAMARKHGVEILLLPSQNGDSPGVPEWKLGAPVHVLPRVTNNTKRVVHFGVTNPGWEYQMDVRDGRGSRVSETDALKKIKEDLKNGPGFIFRIFTVTLQPHQSVADDGIEVSYFFKLDHAGRYTIQISRMIRDFSKKPVRSNRLTFNVNP
jgi:hypothetical protein